MFTTAQNSPRFGTTIGQGSIDRFLGRFTLDPAERRRPPMSLYSVSACENPLTIMPLSGPPR